jgi:hypothetical protein
MKLFLQKKDDKFIPYYKSDVEEFKRLKNLQIYSAEVKQSRNPLFHKKCFAIANCVLQNLPEDAIWHGKDAHALLKACEIQVGFVLQRIKLNGEVYFEPEPLNFAEMDETRFSEFYEKVLPILAGMIGVTVEELEKNSFDYI